MGRKKTRGRNERCAVVVGEPAVQVVRAPRERHRPGFGDVPLWPRQPAVGGAPSLQGESKGGVSERLPELLDAKALAGELGVTRAAAEAIMRRLPIVQFEGLRKVYVRRSDVAAEIQLRTFTKDRVVG
jgi:hypothetical protein